MELPEGANMKPPKGFFDPFGGFRISAPNNNKNSKSMFRPGCRDVAFFKEGQEE